jgi:ABC-type sugar transport system substrate-binding protein
MTRRHLTIPLLVAALAPAACGGSDEPKATSTAAAAPAKKPAALPQELKGTWKTTLRKADAPPGLRLSTRSA